MQPPPSPRSSSKSPLLLKKMVHPLKWALEILRLFNYSVSCLLVILLYPCYNIDSYFWRPEQTRLIIWSVLLHNTHHSISPSDLWIKPCTLWEIQAILILSPHAGDFTTSSVSRGFQTFVVFAVKTFKFHFQFGFFWIFHFPRLMSCCAQGTRALWYPILHRMQRLHPETQGPSQSPAQIKSPPGVPHVSSCQ